MSELQFSARGNYVKITGNTNEKTHCGGVKVYEDKIEISKKGAILPKGTITIPLSTVDNVSSSGTLGMHLTISAQGNDYKISSFSGKSGSITASEAAERIMDLARTPNNSESSSNDSIGVADEIEKLADLRDRGILTDEEFEKKKKDLL